MFLNYFILAISVSIDSLGIGITYGLKNTKITGYAKIILFIISICITSFSICIGNRISHILNSVFINYIANFFIIFMGLFVIYQALKTSDKSCSNKDTSFSEPKIYEFLINFLGITIQIIRNPISSDLDNSKKIDWKEALYLGIALSIDSLCIGIATSIVGYNSFIFPILVASFQLLFLSFGRFIGKKITFISNIPENIWSVLSGILLICIAISRFFI